MLAHQKLTPPPEPWSEPAPSHALLGGGITRRLEHGSYLSYSLQNGITVHLLHTPHQSAAHVSLLIPVGRIHDPVQHPGLAHSLEHLLLMAPGHLPNLVATQKFKEQLEIDNNAVTGLFSTRFHADCPARSLPAAIDFVSHLVFRSDFSDQRRQHETEVIRKERRQPSEALTLNIGERNLTSLIFPKHITPALSVIGTDAALASCSVETYKKFWAELYQPRLAHLIVFGDLSANIEHVIERNLSRVPNQGKAIAASTLSPDWHAEWHKNPGQPRVTIASPPGMHGVQLHLALPGVLMDSPLRPAFEVVRDYFRAPDGWTAKVARGKHALVYGIQASTFDVPGASALQLNTTVSSVSEANSLILHLADFLDGVSAGKFYDPIQAFARRSFGHAFPTYHNPHRLGEALMTCKRCILQDDLRPGVWSLNSEHLKAMASHMRSAALVSLSGASEEINADTAASIEQGLLQAGFAGEARTVPPVLWDEMRL
jgi:hypothetical protein